MTGKRPARYEQIAVYLRSLVAEAAPGDRLPSEADLCERFGVSRMTARQAVQLVAADGLLERRRGAGTFVRSQPVPRDLGSPLSFSESMRERGMSASSKTLLWGEVAPTAEERHELGLDRDEPAFALERVRLADGIPMAIERAIMPAGLAKSLGEGFETGSLHEAFRTIGRSPAEAHASVSARRPTKEERELLGLPAGDLIILERRTIYDRDGAALERTETRYVASRYTFRAVLRNAAGVS